VPVYGVSEQDGLHYYAMQFIQGRGLDVVFAELRAESAESDTITLAAATALLTGRFPGVPATGGSDAGHILRGDIGIHPLAGTAPEGSGAAGPEPASGSAVPTETGPAPGPGAAATPAP